MLRAVLGDELRERVGRAAVGERAAGLQVGHTTFAFGFRIFAVSAMKWTPQKAITSQSIFSAMRASASESPTWSARSWIRVLLVVVREQHGVALALEAPDRVFEIVGESRDGTFGRRRSWLGASLGRHRA